MAIAQSRYSVRDFGAKGDGTTDDSAAFQACITAIWNSYTAGPTSSSYISGDGNRRPNYTFYIPSGTYLLKTAECMMPSTLGANGPFMIGLTYEGDGRHMSYINFQPTAADTFLLVNNNLFLATSFRDITFNGNSITNCCWLKSRAGIAQNYTYERVMWGGAWKYGIELIGASNGDVNLNSEQTFFHCNVNGLWNVFLHVPQSVGMAGDQFVNYNFYGCNMEVSGGSFIDMAYGGSIGIWGGSYMYYAGTPNGGTMFVLRNQVHHNGSTRFMMQGTRVEVPTAVCKMFHCEWGAGAVSFINVDNSTQQSLLDARVMGVNVEFNFGNESGPVVSFLNCALQGKHSYSYGQNTHVRSPRISYVNCMQWHYNSPHEFVDFINADGIFAGGAPLVKFDNCQGAPGTDQSRYVWDTTLNWHVNRSGIGERKVLHLANPWNGGLVGNGGAPTIDVWLPLNSVIKAIRWFMSPGATTNTSAGWVFIIKNANGTTLATATPTGNNPSLGMNDDNQTWEICDTDAKRHITMSHTGVTDSDPYGHCYIEYIG